MSPLLASLLEFWRRIERPLVDALYLLLLLALVIALGWLGARHDHYWDWSSSARNSLSAQSLAIIERLEAPPSVTVFADPASAPGRAVERFLAPYRQALPALSIRYVDPQRFPEQARDAEVSLLGQILIDYRARRELVSELSERALGAALMRLLAEEMPWVAVIEGHGERAIAGTAPSDLGLLGEELEAQGYRVRPLDLTQITEVPVNTQLVVLSMPQISLFPGEIERLRHYVDQGGNLLWLLDPGPLKGLDALAEALGLHPLPGLVIDPEAARLGVPEPAVAALVEPSEANAALGTTLDAAALLPGALAFEPGAGADWRLAAAFASSARSWNELGRLDTPPIERDEVVGERPGPLTVALALSRTGTDAEHEQRVLVVGDGDFASNAFLGVAGNRALALAMLGWLNGSRPLLELPPPERAPEALMLGEKRAVWLSAASLVLLPSAFALLGLLVRWRRGRLR